VFGGQWPANAALLAVIHCFGPVQWPKRSFWLQRKAVVPVALLDPKESHPTMANERLKDNHSQTHIIHQDARNRIVLCHSHISLCPALGK
jgi:hypothetical protein